MRRKPNISGPVKALEDDRRIEVGYFYKNGWAAEIIATGTRGPDLGSLP